MRQSILIGSDIANVSDGIACDHNDEETVIIVVKEPGGKARLRLSHTGLCGDVCEFPLLAPLGHRPVVAEKDLRPIPGGEVEIGPTVVVEVTTDGAFNKLADSNAGLGG